MVVVTLNVGRRKGPTAAFDSARTMHASALVPAAGPATLTLSTLPLEEKTMVAREAASYPSTHARAAVRCDPIAP